MKIKHILLTILLLLCSTTAFASRTYYATFSGCFDFEANSTPLNVGDCYQGRIGFEQQTAVIEMTVTEFWFEVNGERLSFDSFVPRDGDPSSYNANYELLQAKIRGTAPFADGELFGVNLQLGADPYFTLMFGDPGSYVTGGLTGGTAMYYPDSAPLQQMNYGLNDAWYDPTTAGQGFFITVLPVLNMVSVAWYTYDTELPDQSVVADVGDAGHRWLTGLGEIVGNRAQATVDLTFNGLFNVPVDTQPVERVSDYGTFILTMDTCESGTIQYDIPSSGQGGIIPIQRVAGDMTGVCQKLAIDAPRLDSNLRKNKAIEYVVQWMPDPDSKFFLSNNEIRAMINGNMGTPSYVNEMAQIIVDYSDTGFSFDLWKTVLLAYADGDENNDEFRKTEDPFSWHNNIEDGIPGIQLYENSCSNNCGTTRTLTSEGSQKFYELIAGVTVDGEPNDGFLVQYIYRNPEFFGGEPGGIPDMEYNPTWGSQDPN